MTGMFIISDIEPCFANIPKILYKVIIYIFALVKDPNI